MRSGSQERFDDDAERRIRDQLAAQPSPRMPDDVKARLDAALATEADRRVSDPGVPTRPGSARTWWWVGAAAALVLLAGLAVLPQLNQTTPTTATAPAPAGSDSTGTAGTSGCAPVASPGAGMVPVMLSTGTTYSDPALSGQAATLLTQPTACTPVTEPGPAADSTQREDLGSVDPVPGRPYRPADVAAVTDCVVRVAAGHHVLAVDNGWYGGKPVAVAVVEVPPTRAFVIDCAATPIQVLSATTIR